MNKEIFVRLVDTYYIAATGLEGVIVRGELLTSNMDRTPQLGDGVFVDIRNMRPFMRNEHQYLCDWKGSPTRYLYTISGAYDTSAMCEVVDNPFAHWNRLKGGELH